MWVRGGCQETRVPAGSTLLCHVTLDKSLRHSLENSGLKGPLAIVVSSSRGEDGDIVARGEKGVWPQSLNGRAENRSQLDLPLK